MIFHMDNQNHPMAYAKALKFGNVMLKRAKRELDRLDEQMRRAQQDGQDVAALQVQFEQLRQSVEVFEQELMTHQLQYEDGVVDASRR